MNYQLALLDLADATGMVPGRAGLSIDSDIRLPAPESGDPGQDPEAFLRIPSLLQAEREATGGVAPPASATASVTSACGFTNRNAVTAPSSTTT